MGDRLQAAGQFMDRLSQAALPFFEEQEEAADRLKEYLAYADALLYHFALPCLVALPKGICSDANGTGLSVNPGSVFCILAYTAALLCLLDSQESTFLILT
ncbi:hypothetical protein HPB49_026134 [Dermacentor silvarum]|nr:hypothetical protein HPB49_026134 [Dermacentor silvarum]